MSNATLDYASPAAGICRICHQRPITPGKAIYLHPVCKKCYYSLANRRQLAYLIDAILFAIPSIGISFAISFVLLEYVTAEWQFELMLIPLTLVLQVVFAMKDGLNGQSPGKMITDVQVIDTQTYRPISFVQSFKRNWWFLLGVIPFVGGFVQLVLIIIVIVQMGKGPRVGDATAGTRVIRKSQADSPVFGGQGILCKTCGYNLTGNQSGICPECGTGAPPEAVPVA